MHIYVPKGYLMQTTSMLKSLNVILLMDAVLVLKTIKDRVSNSFNNTVHKHKMYQILLTKYPLYERRWEKLFSQKTSKRPILSYTREKAKEQIYFSIKQLTIIKIYSSAQKLQRNYFKIQKTENQAYMYVVILSYGQVAQPRSNYILFRES